MIIIDCLDHIRSCGGGYVMGSEHETQQQQFCLRWHNYQSSLLATLPQLLDGEDLTDVTLSAGGRNLKAHRVVLSASSQYFKSLFKEMQPLQHPVIVLPGTEFPDLVALVTFMYSGEVNIYQHQLPGLLAMADTLQIRGLTEFTGAGYCGNNREPTIRREGGVSRACKRARLATEGGSSQVAEGGDGALSKGGRKGGKLSGEQELLATVWRGGGDMAEDLSRRPETSNTPNEDTTMPLELDTSLATNTLLPTDLSQFSPGSTEIKPRAASLSTSKLYATCYICGKQLSNQYNLRVHMETHLNAHYACTVCNHVSRSRDALRKHVAYRHPPHAPTSAEPKLNQPPPLP